MRACIPTLVLIPLLATLACATMPTTGAAPNGEPLAVETDTKTYQYVAQEKVGEVQHRDANGQYIGSSEVVENRVHTGSYEVWTLRQGNQVVDEQDFFAIAGDAAAAAEIERTRKIGLAANYGGLGGATLGGTLMLAGLSLPWLLSGGIEDPAVLVGLGGLTTVGGLLTAGGVLATIYGRNAVEAEHHQPVERAQDAADSYNRALGDERLAVK